MAKRNHTRDVPVPTSNRQVRFLTVARCPEGQSLIPWIRLRGRWLHQAGFTPQSKVKVRVMTDCLVITREDAPP